MTRSSIEFELRLSTPRTSSTLKMLGHYTGLSLSGASGSARQCNVSLVTVGRGILSHLDEQTWSSVDDTILVASLPTVPLSSAESYEHSSAGIPRPGVITSWLVMIRGRPFSRQVVSRLRRKDRSLSKDVWREGGKSACEHHQLHSQSLV